MEGGSVMIGRYDRGGGCRGGKGAADRAVGDGGSTDGEGLGGRRGREAGTGRKWWGREVVEQAQ
jgi:hypothetical protein